MTRWKYDADQHDSLVQLRIPVTSAFPDWPYTACFDRESRHRPTETEALMIASFIEEYQHRHFGDGQWRKKQQAQEFDLDCPNTTVFHKWAADDWSYRNANWEYGWFWIPISPRLRDGNRQHPEVQKVLTLVQVMDRIHNSETKYPTQSWLTWKAEHPDVFPP